MILYSLGAVLCAGRIEMSGKVLLGVGVVMLFISIPIPGFSGVLLSGLGGLVMGLGVAEIMKRG